MTDCRRCSDAAWVLTSDSEWAAKPCPVCNSEGHERWLAGKMRSEFAERRGTPDAQDPDAFHDNLERVRRTLDPHIA